MRELKRRVDSSYGDDNSSIAGAGAGTVAGATMPDTVIDCVLPYIHDYQDRSSVSLVCKKWCELDGLTRKSVTIAMCYTITPRRLRERFPLLESLTLKGKPRAAMFELIPEDWGGTATPWVEEISKSMNCLKSIHFRRMIVRDSDLKILAESRGQELRVLKLDVCSGFSTDGLLYIGKHCNHLRVLYLQESSILEKDGEWLHELALHNSGLEVLNFNMTDFVKFRCEDLELLAKNCSNSLVSVRISDCELLDLVGFFKEAVKLQEFGGGSFNDQPEKYSRLVYPPGIKILALDYMGRNEMPVMLQLTSRLTKLDLIYALFDTEDHCFLIQRCPNLEILHARDAIGDRGLQVLGHYCKKMRRVKIERGADEEGSVSHVGIIALAQGCVELEVLHLNVTDITNEALIYIGTYLKKLYDFRMILLDKQETVTDFPLDNGIRALLSGCQGLGRMCLYLRPGGLTDVGMGYIGWYGQNLHYMLIGFTGESDAGLLEMSKGLPKLRKIEMRGCSFSEQAMAQFAMNLASLKYLWAQGYRQSESGRDIMAMARQNWNMELIKSRKLMTDASGNTVVVEEPPSLLAYFSLAGQRTDFPPYVTPLYPKIKLTD